MSRSPRQIGAGFGVGAVALIARCAFGQAPSFDLVGQAPGGIGSFVYGLSADGSIAAGYTSGFTTGPGFTWRRTLGRYDFGLDAGMPPISIASAISGDGSTVAGTGGTTSALQAFRWRGPGTYQPLGTLSNYVKSFGEGVSGDGSVVVGRSESMSGFNAQAFRWTEAGGMQALGFTRPGNIFSEARAISRDGGTIVGSSNDGAGFYDAFVWTLAGGIARLPELPGTPFPESEALGVNSDGSIIVGLSGPGQTAAMWRASQVLDLGSAPGFFGGGGLAVNDDGTVVVGYAYGGAQPQRGSIWTPSRGMELLDTYLAANGVVIPPGWATRQCAAVSGDGLTFGGWARSDAGEIVGFVARIPTPASAGLLLTGFALAAVRRRAR